MSNPESSHTMTNVEDGLSSAGGGSDAAENKTHQESNNALNEQAGNENPNGGTEDSETPKDVGQEEVQTGEQEGDTESQQPLEGDTAQADERPPFDPNAFKEDILKSIEEKIQPQPQAPPQLTEEQWVQKENEVGVPRQSIQFFTAQAMKVYETVMNQIEERLAKFEKADALRDIAHERGFEDAPKYRNEIDQYLSRYNVKHHASPQLLKDAVIYARGLAASKNIQRARTESERNKKIAGAARPSSPGGARRTAIPSLNASQRDVASKFGMSDSEYQKLLQGRRAPIAS